MDKHRRRPVREGAGTEPAESSGAHVQAFCRPGVEWAMGALVCQRACHAHGHALQTFSSVHLNCGKEFEFHEELKLLRSKVCRAR